ncbi:uncharacterized protein [Dysidea avara]|uniref:uncharacterized protein n=1 Tax=Dysidea avara TaxID=196820 RepID=UPI003331DFBB
MIATILANVLTNSLIAAHAHVIEVDGTTGNDDPTCYSGNGGPCKTLHYTLENGMASSTTILIHKGTYDLTRDGMSFYNITNITIVGDGFDVTIISCSIGAGLTFFNVDQLTLANFTLLGGGKIMNNCTDVTIDGLMITNSTGTGMAMFDASGKIEIINSIFQYNRALETEEFPGGGGAYITFTYCKPGVTQPCNVSVTQNSIYNVHNCTFLSNAATPSENARIFLPLPIASIHRQFGRGGGLHFMLRGVAENNSITIANSRFHDNSAVWGGGMNIALLDSCKGNQILIKDLVFENNYLPYNGFVNTTGTGGGAIRISVFPEITHNYTTSIYIINSTFNNNFAAFGGGVSSEFKREETNSTVFIYFVQCRWYRNAARLGSAVDAYVHPYPFGEVANFIFDTCSFIENTNHYSDLHVKLLGHGTVYALSVPVTFRNRNTFNGNYGSALVAISTFYIFYNGAVAVFENNTAENGGAISLFESSYIILLEDIELKFTNNMATGKGGAIYATGVTQRDLISSHYCFIVHNNLSVSPYEWKQKNIRVTFSHNHAKYGNSIFATTLYTCVWEGLIGLKETQLEDIEQVFYWNGTFTYEGIHNISSLDQEISSEGAYIHNINKDNYNISPGQLYNFKFKLQNDRAEKIDTALFASTNDSSVGVVVDDQSYSNGYTKLQGDPGSVLAMEMITLSSLPLSVTITIHLNDCPPGFYPSYGSSPNETTCKCSVNVPGKDYIGIIQCDATNLVAYLKPAHYAGYIKKGNRSVLLTSGCPEGYCSDNSSYLQLPSNSSAKALDNIICKPQHRTGTLCGKCADGYYIYANSFDFKCGKCTMPRAGEIVLYIVTKYIPLILFLLIIGFYNISLVKGPLNAFVLFSQSLPYMDIYAGGRIDIPNETVVKIYRFLYGMWDLNFVEVFIPNICVIHVQSALQMMLFDLTPVVIVVVVTYITYHFQSALAKVCRFENMIRKPFIYIVKRVISMNKTITIPNGVQMSINGIKRLVFNNVEGVYKPNQTVRSHNDIEATTQERQHNSNQNVHPQFRIHALLTIVILCYARVTALAFDLLSYATLHGSSKDDSDDSLKVFRYDGTLKYKEHGYYIFAALVALSIVVVIPLILLIYPCCRMYKCCRILRCKIILYFAKLCCFLCIKTNPGEGTNNEDSFKYQCFCRPCKKDNFLPCNFQSCDQTHDSIQECYKRNNFVVARASALYLIYRLITLAIYAFAPSSEMQYLLQAGFFLLMLTINSCFRPYKEEKDIYNVVDACIFTNLTLISVISYHRLHSDAIDLADTSKAFIFQTVLIYIPLLYLFSLIFWRMYKSYVKSSVYQSANNSDYETAVILDSSVYQPANTIYSDDETAGILDTDDSTSAV